MYLPNTVVTPKLEGSLLFAFDSLPNAEKFVTHNAFQHYGVEIWECETESYTYPLLVARYESDIKRFWAAVGVESSKLLAVKKYDLAWAWPPTGTVACSSLVPLRIVSLAWVEDVEGRGEAVMVRT